MVILPEEKIEELKAELKTRDEKQKATQRKQAKRMAGTPAKRINYLTSANSVFGARRYCSAFLDIKGWPPKQNEDIELLVRKIIKRQDGLYTALVQRCYSCHYGYVRKWMDERVCVLPVNVTGKMPIIECFDFNAGEKKSLMYGALGKDSVHDIYENECGTILEGSGKNIYRTTKLWEFMQDTKI